MPAFARYVYLAARVKPEAEQTQEIGRRNLTTEDKLAHVEAWKRSGLTKRDYAKRIGVTDNTFMKWAHGKALGEHGQNSARPQETRNKALELYRSGVGPTKIAEALQVPQATVYGWVGVWKLEGAA